MKRISDRLYISTIADNAGDIARERGCGLEIAEFCTAFNMDIDFSKWDKQVRDKMKGIDFFAFHAAFNELCPAAVDPMIVGVAKRRYRQAYDLMAGYGISAMIAHSGFVPLLYDKGWFAAKSVQFWREFISEKPDQFRLFIENVLEDSPDILLEIAGTINDDRLRLCLDIGHAAYMGKGIPVTEWAERMMPFLGHVHIHNNNGECDSHSAPGEGNADVAAVIRMVAEADPRVTYTIESSDGNRSVEWMEANGFL